MYLQTRQAIKAVRMAEKIDLKYEDFIQTCRLCCKKRKRLTPIYEKIEDVSNDITAADNDSIPAMLLKIGLSVERNDGLPETLCTDCHTKLISSNHFRKQCITSAAQLKDILAKHKSLQIKNEYLKETEEETDDEKSFETFFQIDFVDYNEPDTKDTEFTNGRVEALEITVQNENTTEIVNKRKRGRPKTRVDEPLPVKENKYLKSSETHKTHKKRKKSGKKDICLVCGKVINHNMKGHQAIHDKSEIFKCDICGFESNVKLYLKNHMQKRHVAQRQYPCPHCDLVFMHAVTLKRHATIHTGEKNYVCEECGKSYRQREMLLAHRKRHLPPTIPCSFCDKLFYSKNELKSHTGLHTGIKPFKCDLCSAAFVASSSLAAHRRQHKKDNVLPSCKICGMLFSDRLVYNMHLLDHKRTDQSIAYNSRE